MSYITLSCGAVEKHLASMAWMITFANGSAQHEHPASKKWYKKTQIPGLCGCSALNCAALLETPQSNVSVHIQRGQKSRMNVWRKPWDDAHPALIHHITAVVKTLRGKTNLEHWTAYINWKILTEIYPFIWWLLGWYASCTPVACMLSSISLTI